MEEENKKEKNTNEEIVTKIIDIDDLTDSFDKNEVDEMCKYAVLSYIGFLFLIPILNKSYKKSRYLLFHINQGFNLFALELFIFIILGIFNTIFVSLINYNPIWLSLVNFVLYSIVVVLMLLGILNAVNGKSKTLPIIGKFNYIK